MGVEGAVDAARRRPRARPRSLAGRRAASASQRPAAASSREGLAGGSRSRVVSGHRRRRRARARRRAGPRARRSRRRAGGGRAVRRARPAPRSGVAAAGSGRRSGPSVPASSSWTNGKRSGQRPGVDRRLLADVGAARRAGRRACRSWPGARTSDGLVGTVGLSISRGPVDQLVPLVGLEHRRELLEPLAVPVPSAACSRRGCGRRGRPSRRRCRPPSVHQRDDLVRLHRALQLQQVADQRLGDRARALVAEDRDAVDLRDVDRVAGGVLADVARAWSGCCGRT